MSNNLSNLSLSELTSYATCLQLSQGQTPLISSWLNFKHFIWYQRHTCSIGSSPGDRWPYSHRYSDRCWSAFYFLISCSVCPTVFDSAIWSSPSRRPAPPPEVRSSLASAEVPGSSSDIELGQPSSPLLPVSDAIAGAVPPVCDRLAPSLSPEVELSPSFPGVWAVMPSFTMAGVRCERSWRCWRSLARVTSRILLQHSRSSHSRGSTSGESILHFEQIPMLDTTELVWVPGMFVTPFDKTGEDQGITAIK